MHALIFYSDKGRNIMRVLVLDNSESSLDMLVQSIKEVAPQVEVFSFNKPSELIEFAKESPCDIAFLDFHTCGKSRLEIVKTLKDLYSKINIVFITAYIEKSEMQALQEKPPLISKPLNNVFVRTFGDFEIFIGSKPLLFSRLKAKEAFAYLINKKGHSVTTAEIASALWEDKEYNRSLQNQTQVIISSMMKTLRENGIGDIIIKERNQISIDRSKIKCDYYDFLDWNIDAVNAYKGEYMNNYSWAEMTADNISV